jgi:hypothetical protein
MRTVVTTGGRDMGDRELVRHSLECLLWHDLLDIDDIVVQGGAKGADTLVKEECLKLGLKVLTFHANWKLYGHAAGPRRNKAMIAMAPEYLVAYPGGRGTAGCMEEARAAGIDVCRVTPTSMILYRPDWTIKRHRLHVLPDKAKREPGQRREKSGHSPVNLPF